MRRALRLAGRGGGWTAPNPMVGAVVVRGGEVVGEGWHAELGGPHAEVMALTAAGTRARGADLYVSLEPCTHHGRTPPCTEAVIAAGIRRVIIPLRDPNPLAQGGVDRLRAAGIAVTEGVEAEAAAELNAPFLFTQRVAGRPFVTLKLAVSLDAMLAPRDRSRLQLTGPAAMREVHRMRAQVDAIAVGLGTVLADDPKLTVRAGRRPRVAPTRIVFGEADRVPGSAALVRTARKVPTWVVSRGAGSAAGTAPPRDDAPLRHLATAGVRCLTAPTLRDQLARLRQEGVRHLLAEGGAGLAGGLLTAGLVDRLVIFQAPVLLGAGALAAFGGVELEATAPGELPGRWQMVAQRPFGDDLMTVYAPVASLAR
ncbi:MAG: bifunctional diaminohydroxyphosphoribosylaminopyrimidine deaminase/5-amino-6-(5-phosphoribosylamino)uracil reductase RibD [Gemmatimonadaceae bacterium]